MLENKKIRTTNLKRAIREKIEAEKRTGGNLRKRRTEIFHSK